MRINILKKLETAWAGKTCLCFDVLDSTQTYGKELALREDVHGTLIVADTQSAGKGRRGRIWQSPKGSTISMSLCLEPKICPEHAAGLTLVMAMAVAEGIFELTEMDCQIKWPNDIVLNGKKICGILTELIFKEAGYAVIIGTGINVSTETFPDEIKETATSLYKESGELIPRSKIIAGIMAALEEYYEIFMKTEDMSGLIEVYNERLVNLGNEVCILDPKGEFRGISTGINEAGGLMVRLEDGSETEVISGEVSVRGVYGYV